MPDALSAANDFSRRSSVVSNSGRRIAPAAVSVCVRCDTSAPADDVIAVVVARNPASGFITTTSSRWFSILFSDHE